MRPPYIQILRSTVPDARGLYAGPHIDEVSLILDGGTIYTGQALSLATHTLRHAAPVMAVGEYPDVWCAGTFRGRPAFVAQGEPMRWTRAGVEGSGYTGIHLHSWEGRSDGCITTPQWWIGATLAACEDIIRAGEWTPARHKDGRWMIGAVVTRV